MKLVNYQLQTQIEYLGENKPNNFFKEYLQGILEDTSKPYYQRADYIGLSLNEIKSKIDTLTSDISDLQALKKKLNSALEIAKELTANIFLENIINGEELIPHNGDFLELLRNKADMFKETPDDKSKVNGKKRYTIF